jgi:hypothetical protein
MPYRNRELTDKPMTIPHLSIFFSLLYIWWGVSTYQEGDAE